MSTATIEPTTTKKSRPVADIAFFGIISLAAAWFGAGIANEYAIGDKDKQLCEQIKTEFAQSAQTIRDALPAGNTRAVDLAMYATMQADEIGSFIPWSTRECKII